MPGEKSRDRERAESTHKTETQQVGRNHPPTTPQHQKKIKNKLNTVLAIPIPTTRQAHETTRRKHTPWRLPEQPSACPPSASPPPPPPKARRSHPHPPHPAQPTPPCPRPHLAGKGRPKRMPRPKYTLPLPPTQAWPCHP